MLPLDTAAAPPARVLRGAEAPRYDFAPLRTASEQATRPAGGMSHREAIETASAAPTVDVTAEAFEAGYTTGRAEATASAEAEIADLRSALERLEAERDAERTAADDAARAAADQARETAERLAALWAEAVRAFEPTMAGLAVAAAEGVLRAPLSDAQRQAADHAITDAIESVAATGPAAVRLHPVDLLHLQEAGLAAALTTTHAGLVFEADPDLAAGDWTVTTPESAVHRLHDQMLGRLRERLGLPELP